MAMIGIISLMIFCFSSSSSTLQVVTRYSSAKSVKSISDIKNFSNKEEIHKQFLQPLPAQPLGYDEIKFHTQRVIIDGQQIVRRIPIIDGLVVEGADTVFDEIDEHMYFQYSPFIPPKSLPSINAAEALEKAIEVNPHSRIRDPYVERIEGTYDTIWLMHFDELRLAYKTRLPTISIFDLKDIYVDAVTKEILRIDDTAQFVDAKSRLFRFSPSQNAVLKNELQPVTLTNLVEVKENGFLTGEYINVRTCCRYYTCPNDEKCSDQEKRCALGSHANARQSRELISLPTNSLGFDTIMTLPDQVYVDTVRCTYLPFARASYDKKNPHILGFFEEPIDDFNRDSEMDRFSEVQAYYSVMSFFNHIRFLLNDQTWCLRPEAMSCDPDGKPTLTDEGFPKNPYRIFVNQLVPDMRMSDEHMHSKDSFVAQAMAGKGSKENPIILNEFARFNNAAFIPALSTLKKTKTTPRADEILSDLIKPYDHNVFFQGKRDFAYDGDVVFHEFMHAIIASLVGKMNSLGLDKWGIHNEPGGLNEAWSDYFAAAFTEDPALGQYSNEEYGYGETALRNIDNNFSCPADVIGEVHNDGQIWSGALWEIRSRFRKEISDAAPILFDRAVLSSLATATATEDFSLQGEKLLKNIAAREGLGEKAREIAAKIFLERGITDCFRAFQLSHVDEKNVLSLNVKKQLFLPSRNAINLKNYAVAPLQLEIGIPAGARSMTLTWKQYLGGNGVLIGNEITPQTAGNTIPLSVMTSIGTPIEWKIKNYSMPFVGDQDISNNLGHAYFSNGVWNYSMPLDFERCEQKTMYVSLLSNDLKYITENIRVSFTTDKNQDLSDCNFTGNMRSLDKIEAEEGCTSVHTSGTLLPLMIMLALLRVKRRHRRQLGQRF